MGQGVNAPINALDTYHGMPQPPGPAPPPPPGPGGGETPGGVTDVSGGFDWSSIMHHLFGGGGDPRDPFMNPGFRRTPGLGRGNEFYVGPPGSWTWEQYQLQHAPRDKAGNILMPWIPSEATPLLKQALGGDLVGGTAGDRLIMGALSKDPGWAFDPTANTWTDPHGAANEPFTSTFKTPGTAQALFNIQQRAQAGRAATSPGGTRLTAKERRYALMGK